MFGITSCSRPSRSRMADLRASRKAQPAHAGQRRVIAANLPANMGSQDKQPSGSADRAVLLNTVGTGGDPNGPRSAGEGLSRAQGIIPTAFVEQTVSSRLPLATGSGGPMAVVRSTDDFHNLETSAQPSARPTTEQLSFSRGRERFAPRAVHYLLETWAMQRVLPVPMRMPVAGSTAAVRHFELRIPTG